MPDIHVVKQGEHLPGIAAEHGFTSHKTIFNDPANAELKKLRPNPNILFPGDKVALPDKNEKQVAKPTEQKHTFIVALQKLKFRVKVLDLSDEAFGGTVTLVTGTEREEMKQNGGRIHETDIAPQVKQGKLQFEVADEKTQRAEILLEIGSLDPIREQSGQRERLNNLGYFAGFSETIDPEQFRWAVEEFQADHRETDHLKVTGACDAEKTQPALERAYGMKG